MNEINSNAVDETPALQRGLGRDILGRKVSKGRALRKNQASRI